ncbi:MAG: bestrophin family ion channel [Bacteroidota bacterium]
MFVEKNLSLSRIWRLSSSYVLILTLWAGLIVSAFKYGQLSWLTIPWLPLSVMGTAVAFYLGFKNNSSYDRMWEARKIWGAIVNSSRAWGSHVNSFINNQFADIPLSHGEIHHLKEKLIYRHIAWLYALRSQLLQITQWEHANQSGRIGRMANNAREKYGVGKEDPLTEQLLKKYLGETEYDRLIAYKNTATQIIDTQATDLSDLRLKGLINDFRHIEMQKTLYDFYEHQGKCERIKKFPLPRQYAGVSSIFVWIFILLLPLGMVSEFAKIGEFGIWLSIPFTVLVAWVYWMMETVGDYSENPFQGMANDIPMLSLTRVIEIDLLEMLGEQDLPEGIPSKNGVLM